MKTLLFLLISTIAFFNVNGQEKIVKKINYAKIEIEVPSNYNSTSGNQIENDNFSAQWIYLVGKSFSNTMQIEIFNQLESELKVKPISEVSFISGGGKFIGKKYYMEEAPLKYRIFAYGIVNNQLLILNLGFKDDPKQNELFDDLMIQFIKY